MKDVMRVVFPANLSANMITNKTKQTKIHNSTQLDKPKQLNTTN